MRALLVLLAGCTEFDIAVEAATGPGEVYDCVLPSGEKRELCFFDDAADELGDHLDAACDAPDRRWPWLANTLNLGCVYVCPSPSKGCNALNGCYCPGGEYP